MLLLERGQLPVQPIDRAPRGVGRAFVYADNEKPIVPPLATARERHTVRRPVREKAVNNLQQGVGASFIQRRLGAEDPDAGRVAQ